MRLLIFLFLITAMGMGCSKKSVEKLHSDNDGSTWRLLYTSGGFAGGTTTYGDRIITLSLLSDSTYTQKVNGFLVNSGTYSSRVEVHPTGNDTILVFQYHGSPLYRYVNMNNASQMVLWDGYMDGYFHTYSKVGN